MGISIGQPGAVADPSGNGASLAISIPLQAQVQSAQTSAVEALFGSIGLGTKTNTLA